MTKACEYGTRSDERVINVIDSPGVMDTFPVSGKCELKKQEEILREALKVFSLSPNGIDAIIITMKYNDRIEMQDVEALKTIQTFLGEGAKKYMILLFTWGDQAKLCARRENKTIDEVLKDYTNSFPECLQEFLEELKDRTILFNNEPSSHDHPDESKRQLSQLIQVRKTVRK